MTRESGPDAAAQTLPECLGLAGGGVISLVGAGGKTTLMFALAHLLSAAGEPVLTTTTTKIFIPEPEQSPQLVLGETLDHLKASLDTKRRQYAHITAAKGVAPDGRKLIGLDPSWVDHLHCEKIFRWIVVEADGAAGRPLKAPAPHEPVLPASSRWDVAVAGLESVGSPLQGDRVFRAERFSELTGLHAGMQVMPEHIAELVCHPEGLFRHTPEHAARILFLNKAENASRKAAALSIASEITAKDTCPIDRLVVGSVQRGWHQVLLPAARAVFGREKSPSPVITVRKT